MKKHLALKIKDIEWTFRIFTNAAYVRKHGSKCEAVTLPEDQEVHFNKQYFCPRCVRHELFHVYVSSNNIETLRKFSIDDMEELGASIIGNHLDDIASHCTNIMNFFKGF